MDIIKVIAMIGIVIWIGQLIWIPALIGKERPRFYTYATFIAGIIEFMIVVPLALRVLGII